jgi:hypothetical protein
MRDTLRAPRVGTPKLGAAWKTDHAAPAVRR